jgi:(2R)-3-sulfolactate dehydrogenase (NADP+)
MYRSACVRTPMGDEQESVVLSLAEVEQLATRVLEASDVSRANALVVARSIAAAEADGAQSHGLMRLPSFCEQTLCKKIDGHARPRLVQPAVGTTPRGVLVVDACEGFALPAIELGLGELIPRAKHSGIAALAITRSHNCGVVGHHVEALAERGLVALGFANTPAAIAPWGGKRPFFGTNPIALAAPRRSGSPLVIDQSASVIARGEVMLRAREGRSIPDGWALDHDGKPTTDPRAALAGSMAPAGGYKGVGLALIVEVLAAALTGSTPSHRAPSFADTSGGPPRTGQLFIALDPAAFSSTSLVDVIDSLIEAMCSEPGVRVPGARRAAAREHAKQHGVTVSRALHDEITRRTMTT